MAKPTIDPGAGRIGIGFDIAGIGKAEISIGDRSVGGKLGIGPISIEVGTESASGFESLEWDFGAIKQTTKQLGCTITRETWIVGAGVVESETWTDPKCEPDPTTPTPVPSPNTPGIEGNIPGPKYCKGGFFTLASSPTWGANRTIAVGEAMAADLAGINAGLSSIFGKFDEADENKRADYYFGAGKWKTELRKGVKKTARGHWHWTDENRPDTRLPMLGRIRSEGAVEYDHSYNSLYYYSTGNDSRWFTSSAFNNSFTITNVRPPPVCSRDIAPPPSPRIPNRPPEPMDKKCCAMIAEIHEILAIEKIKAKKVSIPAELLAIPVDGQKSAPDEIIQSYPELLMAILMTTNRYGIDAPIVASVKDSDLTKKGDQADEFTYNSPGVAIQGILELLLEMKAENSARLNLQVRLAYAVTRSLKIVAGVGESVKAIMDALGIKFRSNPKTLPLEFNLVAAKKGGFDKKNKENRPMSTSEMEALLPALLTETEYQLPSPTFDPEDDDIREMLAKILIAVQNR